MTKRYSFYFDSDRCIKCFACEVACLQWHGIEAGTNKPRKVQEVISGKFPDVKRRFISLACHHCANAPCAAACPVEAITQKQTDGAVTVDQSKCNGCRACSEACPFQIPEFDLDGKMQKCDMCQDRLKLRLQPICAATCPTGALRWVTTDEVLKL
jgi:anaerobic dimethyl sulfoxide reductase subunit B (iron-sulfur subunit)